MSAQRVRPFTVIMMLFISMLKSYTTLQAAETPLQPTPVPVHEEPQTAPAPTALTLADCYRLALTQSETIAVQQERLKETEGRFLQALSGVLPRASFKLTEKRQDGSGNSAFTLKDIPERKFVLSQPLFSGFKEFAAMAGSRAEHRRRADEKVRAEQLLFIDVVDSFYLLRERREDLQTLETIRHALVERIDELQERERLGRTRPSEVASAEAQLRRVEAELEDVRSEETTARQLLEFLTGLDHVDAVRDPENTIPVLDPNEETYLAKSASRADVRATEEAWHVAQHEVTIARAKFWPTVGVDGNYYTKRVGVTQDVKWDVQLQVDVPLFQGGQVAGEVQETASRARQAKLQFEQLQRRASLDIRDAYVAAQSAIRRTEALEKALQAAEKSYQLQVQDYRLNLVNNLDVLQALQALEDARRDVIQVHAQLKQRYWHLRVATGDTL